MRPDALGRAANALHSASIHVLRRARMADRATGLSPERLSVLSVLAYAGPRTIGGLAELEAVSAPAISRIVSALERAGLAARSRTAGDAREVLVSTTDKGLRVVEKGRIGRLTIIADFLARLAPDELETIAGAATILLRAGNATDETSGDPPIKNRRAAKTGTGYRRVAARSAPAARR
jgi:DNA-binding MarR family transcriptional regulator